MKYSEIMAYSKVNLREIKRKRGISYFADYKENGKRVRTVIEGNKKLAETICSEIQRRLSLGQVGIIEEKKLTVSFDELYQQYQNSKKHLIRKSSEKRYSNYNDRFTSFMKANFAEAYNNISKIKSEYIKECLDDSLEEETEYGEQWTKKTANGLRGLLKSVFKFAVSKKYIIDNPADEVPKYPVSNKTKVEFFSDKELEKIWGKVDLYWKPFLEFILHTGLRKGEAINLIWDNVDLTEKRPTITIISREDWQTKTGQHRTIPLNKRAVEILEKQAENKKRFVFTSTTGNRISPDDPYQALKKALHGLKLTGDVHKLRHTFASKLVMQGETLFTVGKLLGHSDPKTTEIYAHLSPDHLRGAVDKMI